MNLFHSICESLFKRITWGAKLLGIFVCLAQFTLFVYKYLIIVVGKFQKYHWIQHTNTQPIVVMRERNK